MRAPYSSSSSAASVTGDIKRGPWTPEEDEILSNYVNKEGEGRWRTLPKRAGLQRCGKSCRLRWVNYLRPNVKRGPIDPDEEDLILRLHRLLGNRWSLIAGRIPGRTDNEIKNFWNTHLSKKLINQGIDPRNHKPLNPNPNPPNNDHYFVPPNNTYAPMPSNPPAYQNPPVILPETTGTQFNHEQIRLDNVTNGQNQVFPQCDNNVQNIDRLISTGLPNNHNVYPSYVTDPSGNYYRDSFAMFLDALINEPYGGSSYSRPNATWELAQLGSATENAGDQQQLNDITRHQ